MDENNIYSMALMKWGRQAQMQMMIEEMAELTKAICKLCREGNQHLLKKAVIEEIADVDIMLGQMKYLYPEYLSSKETKLLRLVKKLKKDKFIWETEKGEGKK